MFTFVVRTFYGALLWNKRDVSILWLSEQRGHIRGQSTNQRQPTQARKNVHRMTTIPCGSAIGFHLLNNPQRAEQYHISWFIILSRGCNGGHSHQDNQPYSLETEIIFRTLYLFWRWWLDCVTTAPRSTLSHHENHTHPSPFEPSANWHYVCTRTLVIHLRLIIIHDGSFPPTHYSWCSMVPPIR